MGVVAKNGQVESREVPKSNRRKKKGDEVVEEEETGCWLTLRFFGSCISSRSKVDSSISGTTTHYDNAGVIVNPKGEMKGSAITGPIGKEMSMISGQESQVRQMPLFEIKA